ncbi:RICIN domain-containing protein [Micromonospora sp. CA-259024]|uniref:RICIN domain-containing protein n=1 Tax=Micromonospora sp. CA-259024 TaxID=3239965 RepID=UPI003D914880
MTTVSGKARKFLTSLAILVLAIPLVVSVDPARSAASATAVRSIGEPVTPPDDNLWLYNGGYSRLCALAPSNAEWAPVTQYQCGSYKDQKWNFIPVYTTPEGPYYLIQNVNSQKCLFMPAGSSAKAGQGDCSYHFNDMYWFIEDAGVGGGVRFRNKERNNCLRSPSTVWGAQLTQYQCLPYQDQAWDFFLPRS